MGKLVHHHLYFPTTYTDEGLVGKLPQDVRWLHPPHNLRASPPPIEKRGSWGSCLRTSPPPIQKRSSSGSPKTSAIIPPLCHRCAGTPRSPFVAAGVRAPVWGPPPPPPHRPLGARARGRGSVRAILALALNAAPPRLDAQVLKGCAACHCTTRGQLDRHVPNARLPVREPSTRTTVVGFSTPSTPETRPDC